MFTEAAKQILKWMYQQDQQASGRPDYHSADTIRQAMNLQEADCQLTLRSLAPTYVELWKGDARVNRARLTAEGLRIASAF